MNAIKFSHDYYKLKGMLKDPNFSEVTLLHVFIEDTKNFGEEFIDYDTTYMDEKLQKVSKYPLPKGKVLVLLFQGAYCELFTTIRRWTAEKERYYKAEIGNAFKIVEVKE